MHSRRVEKAMRECGFVCSHLAVLTAGRRNEFFDPTRGMKLPIDVTLGRKKELPREMSDADLLDDWRVKSLRTHTQTHALTQTRTHAHA
eukprot:6179583-Pleurochrysis_carterae.AAC.1